MFRLLPILFLTAAFALTGCGSDSDQKVNSFTLRQLISKALSSDPDANEKLKGLFSNKHLNKTGYNQLTIDSFQVKKTEYYSVLVEFLDPTLNRFAIYDDNLNLYLIDKSLNGYLSDEWVEMGTRIFCFVQERFLTKDVLSLDRLSIYEIKNESANLVYRSLSRYTDDKGTANQTIESVTPAFVVTKMSGLQDKALDNQPDTFFFNTGANEYLSKWNLFNNYVKQKIKEYNFIPMKPQIPSDMLESYDNPENQNKK